jgi:hypothetical protein
MVNARPAVTVCVDRLTDEQLPGPGYISGACRSVSVRARARRPTQAAMRSVSVEFPK